MSDINTTIEVLQIASDRLNWYVEFSIVGTLISLCALAWSIYHSQKQLESSTQAHENSLAAQKKQLEANHDWNRRSFTSQQLKDFILQLSSIRDELDRLTTPKEVIEVIDGAEKKVMKNEMIKVKIKDDEITYINFTDRLLLPDRPLTADEVHEWVCKEKANSETGYEKTAKGDGKPCKTTNNGEVVINNLLEFISIYEQIAVALLNKVFDEQIVKDTLKHPIKRNYEFYKDYIQHRRNNHQDENLGESFKQMYIKFWGEQLTGDRRGKTEG